MQGGKPKLRDLENDPAFPWQQVLEAPGVKFEPMLSFRANCYSSGTTNAPESEHDAVACRLDPGLIEGTATPGEGLKLKPFRSAGYSDAMV